MLTVSSYWKPSDTTSISPVVKSRRIELVDDPSAVLGRFQVRFVLVHGCYVAGRYMANTYYTKIYEVPAAKFIDLHMKLGNGSSFYTMPNGGSVRTYNRREGTPKR